VNNQTFVLPDLGEGLTEAVITRWKVNVGDTVTIDQEVVEVETAKAIVDLPVPFAGKVCELHAEVGATVTVGSPLVTVGAGSGNVLVGYGTDHDETPSKPRLLQRPDTAKGEAPKVISPIVRKLADDNGIDLEQLSPSGAGGIITRADVDRAMGMTPPSATGPSNRIALTGIRKATADKLTVSRREIPDATAWVDADATELLAAKRLLSETAAVSLLALLARLAMAALRQFPELNATFDPRRQEILQHRNIHLGVAVQSPRGLVVPVISNADTLDTVTLSGKLAETISLARAGKLSPAQLSGSTVTLNNYGVFGVDGSAAIINYPEAAILGIGRIIDRPWVVDGELTVRKVTQLSLSFDHRVCDGGSAGRFLRLFADYVQNPVTALGRL
jgi:2-oxoisovalerate dehydrogenase E2 component (dihydrolipoyl transacylase)